MVYSEARLSSPLRYGKIHGALDAGHGAYAGVDLRESERSTTS